MGTYIKETLTRSTYISSIFVTCACIKGASTKEISIENANNACSRSVCIKVSYIGDARGVSTIKGLEIHLQSS